MRGGPGGRARQGTGGRPGLDVSHAEPSAARRAHAAEARPHHRPGELPRGPRLTNLGCEGGGQTAFAWGGPRLAEGSWERLGLVNNAALAPAGRVQKLEAAELERAYAVNAVMPLWLMGFVLRRRPEGAEVRVVNISSGAAQRPFPGLATYCSTKAALRMAGMVVAAEVEDVGVFSYEPGVVDTEMQRATREMPLEEFPWGATFRQYHTEGRLAAPELPAADIVEFLTADGAERFVERRRGA